MCQSMAEGGQRCAAHTRPRYEAATFGTAEWDEAAAEYAASPSGRGMLLLESLAGTSVERRVALETAVKRGDALRGVAAETKSQVAAAFSAAEGFPSVEQIKIVASKHKNPSDRTFTLQDDKGRVFSKDGKNPQEFNLESNASSWVEISSHDDSYHWIPASAKKRREQATKTATGIPAVETMQPVPLKSNDAFTLQDDQGRAFSADGKKVFEFGSAEQANDWREIAAKPAAFNRWIAADTKSDSEPFPWENRNAL